MCTYNLTFNDNLVEKARRSFASQAAITEWMQIQMERMLKQIAIEEDVQDKPVRKISISDKVKALSNVPATDSSQDYKNDIEVVLSSKY